MDEQFRIMVESSGALQVQIIVLVLTNSYFGSWRPGIAKLFSSESCFGKEGMEKMGNIRSFFLWITVYHT